MAKLYHFIGFLIFFLLVWLDVVVVKNPSAGKIATVLWFVSYAYLIIFALKCLYEIIYHSLELKAIFTILLLTIWFLVIAVNITNPKNISGETTQEINCALNHLATSPDWGYAKPCFLGYPTKQYFFMALPTIIFGRSLITLNLGAAFIFLLGIIIFSGGILRFFQYKRYGDLITAFLLASIFHFYYVNHFLLIFEQPILPFSFGLLVTGLFFYYLEEKKNLILCLVGFVLLYLIFTFTPGLALYFLSTCVLFYLLFNRKTSKRQKLLLLGVIFLSLISYYYSLKFRIDIKLVSLEVRNQNQLINDLIQAFHHLLFQSGGHPVVSPIFNFPFISLIIISVLFIFGWKFAFLSLWIIGVLILSVISRGYSYYGIDFRLNRASVVFPVFLAMFAFFLKRFHLEDKGKYLFGILLVILLTGIYFQKMMLDAREPSRHLLFINWLRDNLVLEKEVSQKKNIYFLSEAQKNYVSLNDQMQYFIPQLTKGQYTLKDCRIGEAVKGIFVMRVDDPCYLLLLNSGLVNYGKYKYKEDEFGVFEKN